MNSRLLVSTSGVHVAGVISGCAPDDVLMHLDARRASRFDVARDIVGVMFITYMRDESDLASVKKPGTQEKCRETDP